VLGLLIVLVLAIWNWLLKISGDVVTNLLMPKRVIVDCVDFTLRAGAGFRTKYVFINTVFRRFDEGSLLRFDML
jgi:hypothetical protein